MDDSDRFKLHHGPYTPPRCRVGEKLPCEYRGREVKVNGMSDAPIQWPVTHRGPRPRVILCGDLIRAVRLEAGIAVAHHWGVDKHTVRRWRRALGVPPTNEGTRRLFAAYTPERLTPEAREMGRRAMRSPEVRAKISAAKIGKPLHPNALAAQKEAVRRPKSEEYKREVSRRMLEVWEHPEEHGLPPCHHWTEEEIALLGTDTDGAIAGRLGLPRYTVESKRRRLKIASIPRHWIKEEIALLGTDTDRAVGLRLGKTEEAVRRKRLQMGIPGSVSHWTEEEIALLGADTDDAIAKRIGRSRMAVADKRRVLRIPAHGPEEGSGDATDSRARTKREGGA